MLARSLAFVDRLSASNLGSRPFDPVELAVFGAELHAYSPRPHGKTDSPDAAQASLRAQTALEMFTTAWVATGPLPQAERDWWIENAVRLASDSDILVRKQCAILLWVVRGGAGSESMPERAYQVLKALRDDPFIKDEWTTSMRVIKERAEKAGRTWTIIGE
jgi:hypothetical protein